MQTTTNARTTGGYSVGVNTEGAEISEERGGEERIILQVTIALLDGNTSYTQQAKCCQVDVMLTPVTSVVR